MEGPTQATPLPPVFILQQGVESLLAAVGKMVLCPAGSANTSRPRHTLPASACGWLSHQLDSWPQRTLKAAPFKVRCKHIFVVFSVARSSLNFRDPMVCGTPELPVPHQLWSLPKLMSLAVSLPHHQHQHPPWQVFDRKFHVVLQHANLPKDA